MRVHDVLNPPTNLQRHGVELSKEMLRRSCSSSSSHNSIRRKQQSHQPDGALEPNVLRRTIVCHTGVISTLARVFALTFTCMCLFAFVAFFPLRAYSQHRAAVK